VDVVPRRADPADSHRHGRPVPDLGDPAIRWVSVVAAIFLVVFNLVGLPYPSAFDNFLIGFGFLFNGLIVWYAWTWV
jgi:hypothetical protein